MNLKYHVTALLLFTTLILSSFSLKAQNDSDTICMRRNVGEFRYFIYKNDEPITFKQAMRETASNNEAYRLMRTSKHLKVIGNTLEVSGALCLGFAIGYALVDSFTPKPKDKYGQERDRNTEIYAPLCVTGVMFIGIGICFEVGANKKTKKAIAVYNNSIKQKNTQALDLGISANGIMLKLNF